MIRCNQDCRGDDVASNLDILLAEMGNRGFEAQTIMTDASTLGCPARRRRVYVVFLKVAGNRLVDFGSRSITSMFATLRAVMCSCIRSPCCGTEIPLPADDPAVAADLELREVKRQKRDQAAQKAGPTPQTWMDSHMAFARQLKFRWGQQVPASLRSNPCFQTLTKREQDVLRLAQVQSPKLLFRDLSQSVQRANIQSEDAESGLHVFPTVLPKMLLWLEGQERVWLGREALMCQGFPVLPLLSEHEAVKRPQAWSPTEALMQDLAGNAMALPVLMAILQSMFAAFSWEGTRDDAAPSPRRAVNSKDKNVPSTPLNLNSKRATGNNSNRQSKRFFCLCPMP